MPTQDDKITKDQAADEKAARELAFKSEQEGRQARFDRDQEASARTQERTAAEAEEKAALAEKLRLAQEENDNLALQHGWLTDADLEARNHAPLPHDAQWPHQVLQANEPTVKMGFPRNVLLVLPAADPTNPVHTGGRVYFRKGYNDVPESLADHPYLHASGARRVDGEGKSETDEARTERAKAADKTKTEPKK